MGIFENVNLVFSRELSVKKHSEANTIAKEQGEIWSQTIEKLILSIKSKNEHISISYLEIIKGHISSDLTAFSVEETDSAYIVRGDIPLITRVGSILDNLISSKPLTMYGVLYFETSRIRNALKIDEKVDQSIIMIAGAYIALKDSSPGNTEKEIVPLHEEMQGILHNFQNDTKKALADFDASQKSRIDSADVMQKNQKKIWDNLVEKSKLDIDASKKLAFENETLKSAKTVWKRKIIRHRIGYWAGMVVILVVVACLLYFGFQSFDPFIANLAKIRKGDGDIPYGIIVFLLIPIIAIGWVLKIFNRFVTNSLVLAEDAEQRETMIDTYLRLVGNPDAKMETSDRTIVLGAIFRPLPGQQTDDLSPPTFIEIASSSFTKKEK